MVLDFSEAGSAQTEREENAIFIYFYFTLLFLYNLIFLLTNYTEKSANHDADGADKYHLYPYTCFW